MAVDQSTCGKCGNTFERARRGRPPKFCPACRVRKYVPPRAHVDITCPCGETFTGDARRKYCSRACNERHKPSRRGSCAVCGTSIALSSTSAASPRCRSCAGRRPPSPTAHSYSKGCRCDECRAKKAEENRAYAEKRRAAGRPINEGKARTPRQCIECGSDFMARVDSVKAGGGKYCSVLCGNRVNSRKIAEAKLRANGGKRKREIPTGPRKSMFRKRAERLAAKAAKGTTGGGLIWVQGPCAACGTQFMSPGVKSRYCSTGCRVAVRGTIYDNKYRLRVKRETIFERDGWNCQICSEPVDAGADPQSDWYPSIDHIIPRSHGGSDDIENLRTAHRWCNSVRGDLRYYTDADLAA